MGDSLKDLDALPMLSRDRLIVVKKVAAAPGATPAEDPQGRLEAVPPAPRAPAKRARRQEVGQGGGDDSDEEDGDGAVLTADDAAAGAGRSYPISLASETPVEQWFGNEILDHSAGAVDLSRSDGMPLLMNHRSDQQIGVIKNLRISKDRKLRGEMQFSKSAAPIEQDVIDGIRRNMSIGYRVAKYEYEEGKGDKPDTYTATRWQPMEASIVSVPADHTVGVNRSSADAGERFPVQVIRHRAAAQPTEGANNMAGEQQTQGNGAAGAGNGAAAAADAARIGALEIVRMGQQHGMSDRVAKWLEDGRTPDQVRIEILEARATKPIAQPPAETGDNAGLKLGDKEARQYSYSRAILAAANLAEGRRENSFEVEISEELIKRMPQQFTSRGGLLIPTTLRGTKYEGHRSAVPGLTPQQARALEVALTRSGTIDSQTANAIKEVVFTEYGGELIEILRNMAKVASMGARVLTGLSSPIGFPRQTGDVTATWVAENSGTNVASSNVTTDIVTLTPRSLMATTAYSRQLLVQSSVDVEAMVRISIARKHALAWDQAGIHGTGINSQPLGIYNQPNVQTIDFSNSAYYGATANHVAFTGATAMQTKLATANALFGALGYLTTPGIAADAITTLRFPSAAIAQGGQLWNGTVDAGEMAGYKAESTNQVSATMGASGAPSGGSYHGLIFGNWQELLIGQFGGAMEMIVDPYSLKKQALIEVASFQMADVALRHPVSFCVGINLSA